MSKPTCALTYVFNISRITENFSFKTVLNVVCEVVVVLHRSFCAECCVASWFFAEQCWKSQKIQTAAASSRRLSQASVMCDLVAEDVTCSCVTTSVSRCGTRTWSHDQWRHTLYTSTCAVSSAPSMRMIAFSTSSSVAGALLTGIYQHIDIYF